LWLFVFLAGLSLIYFLNYSKKESAAITFNEFINSVKQKKIDNVVIDEDENAITGKFRKDYKEGQDFVTSGRISDFYLKVLEENGLTPNFIVPKKSSHF